MNSKAIAVAPEAVKDAVDFFGRKIAAQELTAEEAGTSIASLFYLQSLTQSQSLPLRQ